MQHTKIKSIIEELLKLMNVSFETVVHLEVPESNHSRFMVSTIEPTLLIGTNGENLDALNYIVRRVATKVLGEETPVKFFIDVNGYQEQALEALKVKAKIMSERARSLKADIELDPMSSYERMLIHSYLDGASDIKTESKGEGSLRRVVIKYLAG